MWVALLVIPGLSSVGQAREVDLLVSRPDPLLTRLIELGDLAVDTLEHTARKRNASDVQRGWAVVCLSQIGTPRADAALDAIINDVGAGSTVRQWAWHGRLQSVERLPELSALYAVSGLVRQKQSRLNRDAVNQRAVDILRSQSASPLDVLSLKPAILHYLARREPALLPLEGIAALLLNPDRATRVRAEEVPEQLQGILGTPVSSAVEGSMTPTEQSWRMTIDERAMQAERERARTVTLADLSTMTMTVIDGDFPRNVLRDHNLSAVTYHMPGADNRSEIYNAREGRDGTARQMPGSEARRALL